MKRVFACIGFSMAVTLTALCFVNPEYILIITIGLAILFVASLLLPKYRKAVVMPLSLGAAVIACLLLMQTNNNAVYPLQKLQNETYACSFYATDEGRELENTRGYNVKITKLGDKKTNIKSYIYLDKEVKLRPYTLIKGRLTFYPSGENAFQSYGKYADGIYVTAKCVLTDSTAVSVNSPLKHFVSLRQSIKDKLSFIMPDNLAGLSVALITGDKSYLNNNVKLSFMYSGTSHIMAVSGMHIGVITSCLYFLLKRLKLNDKLSSLVSLLGVLCYMALASFSGSVTRAGIMMIVMLSAGLFSMRGDSLNSLGIAVTVMCVANPYCVTDVGTMLSVVSALSLITVYPHIAVRLMPRYKDKLQKTVKERLKAGVLSLFRLFYMSLTVVVFTIPVVYFFFGYTSIVGPIANILAVPLGSLCVVLSGFTYIASLVGITPITAVAVLVTTKCDALLIKLCMLFRGLGNTIINFDYMFGLLLVGVMMIFAVAYLLENKALLKPACALSLVIAIFCTAIMLSNGYQKATVRIFSNGAMVCTYKDKTLVYGVDSKDDYYDVKSYLQNGMLYVDYLVVADSAYYSTKLSNNVYVNCLLCDSFDDRILVDAQFNELLVKNNYNVILDDSLAFCYNRGEVILYFNDITVGSTQNSDISVSSSNVKDSNGTIILKDSSVVYSIKNKNSFTARRLNQWQR